MGSVRPCPLSPPESLRSPDSPPERIASRHPFSARPHRTLLLLTLPILVSLLAEPLTGLIDTFFVARTGASSLAALGVATALLSGVFWIFNFLGIGTQTTVARALGAGDPVQAAAASRLGRRLALASGVLLCALCWPFLADAARGMGARGPMQADALLYLRIRLLGAPATLAMLTAFGALRGLQDMRTPLWVALGSNALNLVLDPLLIFGWGPVPAWGLAGAAWASTVSHLVGAIWALHAVQRKLPHAAPTGWAQALAFLRVGGNLVVRTGALLFFLILATRTATRAGTEAGAIHQVVRQVWVFTAFALDAFAGSAQSLVSYFLGAEDAATARRVARVSCGWALTGGIVLCLVTLALEDAARIWLLPSGVVIGYAPAWRIAALALPVSALSFVTDGIHWGSSDYRYLRNGMLVSTGVGVIALLAVDPSRPDVLTRIWAVTAGWLLVRAAWGLLRIWPGVGRAPLSGRGGALARPGDGRAAG